MLYTQEENLSNGDDDLFLLFKSQGGSEPFSPPPPPGHAPVDITNSTRYLTYHLIMHNVKNCKHIIHLRMELNIIIYIENNKNSW